MKTQLFLLVLIAFAGSTDAQSILWMRDAGSTPFSANEHGDAVDTDADGNAYVLGHLSIDSQFSGLPVQAHQDGCIAKYNAFGTVQWVRTFGGPGFVDIQETAGESLNCRQCRVRLRPDAHAVRQPHGVLRNRFVHLRRQQLQLVPGEYYRGNFQRTPRRRYRYGAFTTLTSTTRGASWRWVPPMAPDVFEGQTITSTANMGVLARYLPDGTLTDLVQLADSANDQQATAVEVAPGSGTFTSAAPSGAISSSMGPA